MRAAALCLVALPLLSCSSGRGDGLPGPPGEQGPPGAPGSPEGSAQSGTRIKSVTLTRTTPDGLRVTYNHSLRDSVLEADCLPGSAEDGVIRCIPYPRAPISPDYFLNSACAEQVATVNHSCDRETPKYAYVELPPGEDVCIAPTRTYRLGAQVQPSTFYRKDGPGCVVIDRTTADALAKGGRWFAVGAALAPGDLVPLTETKTVQ